ncbi:MAG: hypothetical protein IJ300_13730 [Clostridia bacterium]|nr:hypothetical protein [Clostridia bacterium]
MKKICSLMLALVLFCSCLPMGYAAAEILLSASLYLQVVYIMLPIPKQR